MASIVGNSVLNLCRAAAQEVGGYQTLALTTTGGSGFQVISTSAIDTEAPTDRHGGKYLYSHGPSVIREQQRVTKAGFIGGSGTFTVAKSFSTAPASGTTMSLLGTIPWIDQDDLIGLVTCLNRTLRKLTVRYKIPITSTGASDDNYDLGAYWWATRGSFVGLYDPEPSGTGHSLPSSTGWNVEQNGEIWTLQLGSGFPSGDVFYLEVDAPANSRLYNAQTSTWGQTTSPVSAVAADGDACLGGWNTVFQCFLFEVYRALSIQAGGVRKAYWEKRLNGGDGEPGQRAVVGAIKAYQMDGDDWTPNSGQEQGPGSWGSAFGTKGLFAL